MSEFVAHGRARTALDAGLALHNAGGAGFVKLFTGTAPATCETADSGTLLAQLALSTTAFNSSGDTITTGLAVATAKAVTSATAVGTGTAGYYRSYSNAGVCLTQGSVGVSGSGANFIINNTAITIGDTVSCSSWTETLPDGSGND